MWYLFVVDEMVLLFCRLHQDKKGGYMLFSSKWNVENLKSMIVSVVGLAVIALNAGDVSEPVPIIVEPENYYLWHTATNASLRLEWDMPPSAGYADLLIEGVGYVNEILNITDNHCDVALPRPTDSNTENVYRFTLNYSDGSSVTAVLGLVCGHTAQSDTEASSIICKLSKQDLSWSMAGKKYVVPVPQNATLWVNDQEIDTYLSGQAGWYAAGMFDTDTLTRLKLAKEQQLDVLADVLTRGIGCFIILR